MVYGCQYKTKNINMKYIDLNQQYVSIKTQIDERIQRVLDHGQYIMGPEVRELEQCLEVRTGQPHCITVSSGTDALLIALMALNVGPGDEIITTPFTFIATAEVIVLLGATPVFVDIEEETCNINASKIEFAITNKTKAIIPVSLYGQPCDMDEINKIAEKYGVTVIEDAAQSFGATYRGMPSCNVSKIACTSFFPSKPLGCYGDGGAIFTNDGELAQVMREIRVHGQTSRYFHTRIGVGGRMDTLQCAVVLAKLETFDWELNRREEIANRYQSRLDLIDAIDINRTQKDRTSAWAQFTIRSNRRNEIVNLLNEKNIPTAVHYPTPIHMQPAYEHVCKVPSDGLAESERASKRVLSLPMHPFLNNDEIDEICMILDKVSKLV